LDPRIYSTGPNVFIDKEFWYRRPSGHLLAAVLTPKNIVSENQSLKSFHLYNALFTAHFHTIVPPIVSIILRIGIADAGTLLSMHQVAG